MVNLEYWMVAVMFALWAWGLRSMYYKGVAMGVTGAIDELRKEGIIRVSKDGDISRAID